MVQSAPEPVPVPEFWDMRCSKTDRNSNGDGIVMHDIESTIEGIGKLGKDGMRETNEEIIRLMIAN